MPWDMIAAPVSFLKELMIQGIIIGRFNDQNTSRIKKPRATFQNFIGIIKVFDKLIHDNNIISLIKLNCLKIAGLEVYPFSRQMFNSFQLKFIGSDFPGSRTEFF